MVEYEAVHLRVDPQAIPQLRAAFERAIVMLEPAIADLGQYGHIDGAWMGDPKSIEVAELYNDRVMNAPDGPYQALVLYQRELIGIVDRLYEMEQDYQRTEQGIADTFDGGVL